MAKRNGLYSRPTGGKVLVCNGTEKFFPPIRSSAGAYDSARTNGRGGQDRDDIDDETDADEREDGELFGNLGRDEERDLERVIGEAVSDGIRKYRAARDRRRAGKDADPSDHLDDFDPLDERRAREAYRDRDGADAEEILGQVPAKSTMTLRRTSADSKLGYDSRRLTREQIDSRPAQAVAGRQVRGSLSDELDELFGHRGRA